LAITTADFPWAVYAWFEDSTGNRDDVSAITFASEAAAMRSVFATLSHLRATDRGRLGGSMATCCVAQIVGPGTSRTASLFSTWEPIEWEPPEQDECTMLPTDGSHRMPLRGYLTRLRTWWWPHG
jgi:hypothetical protein